MRLTFALLLGSCNALVVTVTHASGRMGVSVIGQLRERYSQDPWVGTGRLPTTGDLKIRAVVSTEEEAAKLRLDLCGAVVREGKMLPLVDLENDLGVELIIATDDAGEQQALMDAFVDADIAVLLSASHAEFSSGTEPAGPLDATEPVSVADALRAKALANSAYLAAVRGGDGVNVRVRPIAGARAARRLGAEISAAVAREPKLRHVVLRSSMGVRALNTLGELPEGGERRLASLGVRCMGGEATLAATADAEAALRTRCGQLGVPCTVLRFGALVDGAGGVPLAFGASDAQLLSRLSGEGEAQPPIISRNDAARLVVDVIARGRDYDLANKVVDAAWEAEWGIPAAGTDEAQRAADAQDLVGLASRASRPTLPTRLKDEDLRAYPSVG